MGGFGGSYLICVFFLFLPRHSLQDFLQKFRTISVTVLLMQFDSGSAENDFKQNSGSAAVHVIDPQNTPD